MFELLKERFSHSFTMGAFLARHIKKDQTHIKKDEKSFEKFKTAYTIAYEKGSIDSVKKNFLGERTSMKKEISAVIDLEINSFLMLDRVLKDYRYELLEFYKALLLLKREDSIIKNSLDDKEKKQFKYDIKIIMNELHKDTDFIREISKHMSRISRDTYEGLKDEKSIIRMRDQLMAISSELQASFKAIFLKRGRRKVVKDEKHIDKELHRLLVLIEKTIKEKNLSEKEAKELIKLINLLATDIKKEESHFKTLLQNSRFLIMVAVRHFFHAIDELVELKKQDKQLDVDKFPSIILKRLEKELETTLTKEEKEAYHEMHIAYQMFNKYDDLDGITNNILQKGKEDVQLGG